MRSNESSSEDFRLICKVKLCKRLSVSEASIDRWIRSDPHFPQPVRLGPNTIRWIEREVLAYILSRPRIEYDDHAFSPNDPGWR